MTGDLGELYRDLVVDHSRRPRHFHDMPDAHGKAQGFNPFCGDRVTVYIKTSDDTLSDVSFQGSGCAICTASASLMTQVARRRRIAEVERLVHWFHELLTASDPPLDPFDEDAEALAALAGVRQFPIRVKCATLPWHALKAALRGEHEPVSTEKE